MGSLFALAGKYRAAWARSSGISDPPTFGLPAVYSAEPVEVSRARLLESFVEGHSRYERLWHDVLARDTFESVELPARAADGGHAEGLVPPPLWFRIVYDFLVAYNARHVDPAEVVAALVPLYHARTASFVAEAEDDTDEEAEAKIKDLVRVAQELKPYLVERWREGAVPDRMLADQPVSQESPMEDWVH